jgi:hypothetical protein
LRWESTLVPHLGDLPFTFVGKGEQASLKILLAPNMRVDGAHIILVEEPENHLAFCRMDILITKILEKCPDRQGLVTTHSSYVRNKFGLEQLVLLTATGGLRLSGLTKDTKDYVQKLPGYAAGGTPGVNRRRRRPNPLFVLLATIPEACVPRGLADAGPVTDSPAGWCRW